MATALNKPVRRAVKAGRFSLVVELQPGEVPVITVREKGRRGGGHSITVEGLHAMLSMKAAEARPRRVRRTRLRGV